MDSLPRIERRDGAFRVVTDSHASPWMKKGSIAAAYSRHYEQFYAAEIWMTVPKLWDYFVCSLANQREDCASEQG